MEVIHKPLALLIHGWDDDPQAGWLGWLDGQLTHAGYLVKAPKFSPESRPMLPRWHNQLAEIATELNESSIIIAHSLGTFLSLRLLESLPSEQVVGTVILISGFYDAPDERASRWFDPEPDWSKIRAHAKHFICIYSDDDHIVTPDRTRRLAHQLQAELLCIPNHGHFLGSRGMGEFLELVRILEDHSLYKIRKTQ